MPKSFRLWHAHLSYIQLVTPREAAIAVKIDEIQFSKFLSSYAVFLVIND